MNARGQLVLMLAALLAGCAPVGPDYVRPETVVPPAYKGFTAAWTPARPGDTLPKGKWWELFGDPQLNALAERVDPGNQSIRQAEARYAQAQAVLRQAQAQRIPLVSANGRVRGTRDNDAGLVGDYQFGLDASWEADVWGRVRRSVEAGEAQAQAAAADIESVRLSVTAALVQSYLALRVTDAQIRLLEETVAAFERSLKLTLNRYKAGVAGKSDVAQAQVQVKSNQAQLVDLGIQRAQFEHAIAVLIGEPPAALALAPTTTVMKLPSVPVGVPSELLQRRPDIASAERRVAAANARVGVAQAAFYPSVTLTGTVIAAPTSSELLQAPTWIWALGAAAAQVLFDGGGRQAATEQARAVLDAEAAAYRQAVLGGFQEVEDSLATLRILEAEAKLQAETVAAARESVKLTENRYRAGSASFLEVIVVQTIALNNERAAIGILGRQLSAAVQLVRALGGGWDTRALEPALAATGADNAKGVAR